MKKQQAHNSECWRLHSHHACAVAMIERLKVRLHEQTMQTQETAHLIHGRVLEAINARMTPPEGLSLWGHPIEQIVGTCMATLAEVAELKMERAAEAEKGGEVAGVRKCPHCHGRTVLRDSRVRKEYWWCSNPECPAVRAAEAEKG